MLNPFELFGTRFFGLTTGVKWILVSIFQYVIFPFVLFISTSIVVFYIFKYNADNKNETENKTKSPKIAAYGSQEKIFGFLYPQTLIIAFISIIFISAAYPSWDFSDIKWIWREVEKNVWSEWHTVGYILFVHFCRFFGGSKFGVPVVQTILWIFINNMAFNALYKHTKSKRACNIYLIASCVIFTPTFYLQLMFKDVPFSMCLFAFCVAAADVLISQEPKRLDYIKLAAFAVPAALLRHGSVFPVFITLIVLVFYKTLNKRDKYFSLELPAFAAGAMAAIIFTSGVLSPLILRASSAPSYITYSKPMQMAAAIVASGCDLTESEIETLEKIMPLEEWESCYDKRFSDPASRPWALVGENIYKLNESEYQRAILKLNALFFIKYPVKYTSALLDSASIIWELGRPNGGYEWTPVNGSHVNKHEFEVAFSTIKPTAATNVIINVAQTTQKTPVLRSIFWRGGVWLFLLILAVVLCFHKKESRLFIALLPAVISVLMLFLSIPAQDPRYILPVMEISLFFFIFVFELKKRDIICK